MQSGQKVRDYVFEEKIGTGGMGEIWRALHAVLQRQVAIKMMDPHLARDPEFEQRFVQEARAQATLQHRHILQVTDFFSEGGVYYLVMPLFDGVSLEARLAQNRVPLPLVEAIKIAHDVLEGLDYAHQHGIIHRDVKPSNILLDASGHAYLLDFGIALMIGQDRRTRTGASLGTPHYMSPEQIQHPQKIDHRADVYSAGCVIYEMLTGRPPFGSFDEHGDTPFFVQQAHVAKVPEPVRKRNPTVPPGVDAVILRALAKDPDQRWSGCGEFLHSLENHGGAALFEDPRWSHSPPPPVSPLPLPSPMPTALPVPPDMGKGRLFWGLSSVFGCLILGVLMTVLVTVVGRARNQEEEPIGDEQTTDAAAPEPTSTADADPFAGQTPDQPATLPSPTPPEREVKAASPNQTQLISPMVTPSFDCLKASNNVERLVCSSPELAVLDLAMANAYRDLVAERTSPDQRKQLRDSQNHWLRRVRDRCPDIACLESTYESRIEELRSARR